MGLLDKLKRNKQLDDDELDDIDLDLLDLDEDGDGAPSGSSGGGIMGRARGLLKRGRGSF